MKKKELLLHMVKAKRIDKIKPSKANWIVTTVRTECFIKYVIKGKTEEKK